MMAIKLGEHLGQHIPFTSGVVGGGLMRPSNSSKKGDHNYLHLNK